MWYVITGILIVLIVILSAWGGLKTVYSAWQLKQKRGQIGSDRAKLDLERLSAKPTLINWQIVGLIVLYVALFASLRQLAAGHIAWLVLFGVVLFGNAVAKLKPIRGLAQNLYNKTESKLLVLYRGLKRLSRVFNLSSLQNINGSGSDQIESIEELLFLIDNSPGVVNDRQKRLIKSGLKFSDSKVEKVFIPIDELMSLATTDLIGPLVLDDLHRSGNEYFPVINREDEVVGIFNLFQSTSLDDKTSKTAQELSDKNFLQVDIDDSLDNVLNQMLTEQTMVAVVRKRNKTMGLVKLSDIIAYLVGDKM